MVIEGLTIVTMYFQGIEENKNKIQENEKLLEQLKEKMKAIETKQTKGNT